MQLKLSQLIASIMDSINSLNSEKLKENLMITLKHTIETLKSMQDVTDELEKNKNKIKGVLIGYDYIPYPAEILFMLMFIHDFYKLADKSGEHGENAFQFLEQDCVRYFIRFHDAFGTIHTGEASYLQFDKLNNLFKNVNEDLMIKDCGNFPKSLTNKRNDVKYIKKHFINTIIHLTCADVGNFLNAKRMETYIDIRNKLISEEKIDVVKICNNTVEERFIKLIESNNRAEVKDNIIEQILNKSYKYKQYKNSSTENPKFKKFNRVRFDAGVYVLEPYFRYLIGKKLSLKNNDIIQISSKNKNVLENWIHNIIEVSNIMFEKSVKNSVENVNNLEVYLLPIKYNPKKEINYSIKNLDSEDECKKKIERFISDFKLS